MGYLLIDNTASGGARVETDTTFCRHCQAVIDKRKWRQDNGIWYCSKCAGPCCHSCTSIAATNNYTCTPYKKQIEDTVNEIERRHRFFGTSSGGGLII